MSLKEARWICGQAHGRDLESLLDAGRGMSLLESKILSLSSLLPVTVSKLWQ